jgi:NTP pyrophosphatase (non-canonical NTP hydrolase)
MEIRAFQDIIRRTYYAKDRARGIDATYMWFIEEVGELASALREGTKEERAAEFADVYAWMMTLANLADVDMEEALSKYSKGCCGCGQIPCECRDEKP